MNLRYCTLTGVDDSTSLGELKALSREFPFVEWGILYSPEWAGKRPRFPVLRSQSWITDLMVSRMHVSLHVCGLGVNELVGRSNPWLSEIANEVGRVQLNLRADRFGSDTVREVVTRLHARGKGPRVILPANTTNLEVCEELDGTPGLEFIWDYTGQRRKGVQSWPARTSYPGNRIRTSRTGFATEVGPDKIEEELRKVVEASGSHPFWVDVQDGVRDEHDQFDIAKARQTLLKMNVALQRSERETHSPC